MEENKPEETIGLKIIIAGSRDIKYPGLVEKVIKESIFYGDLMEEDEKGKKIAEVVCGMARGPDQLGHIWATRNGIRVKQFPAQWDRYGNRAGLLRNVEMAEYADGLIAVWDGKSHGTEHMIEEMKKRGKSVYVYIVGEREMEACEMMYRTFHG